MNKIGIIGAGTGALPPEVLKMAEEANVEIVELPRRNSGIFFGYSNLSTNFVVMKASVESVLLNTSSRSVEIFAEILNAITSCEKRKRTPCVHETHTGAFPCLLQFLFRLRLRFNPYVGNRARKKRKINIRGVLIELLGFHV